MIIEEKSKEHRDYKSSNLSYVFDGVVVSASASPNKIKPINRMSKYEL